MSQVCRAVTYLSAKIVQGERRAKQRCYDLPFVDVSLWLCGQSGCRPYSISYNRMEWYESGLHRVLYFQNMPTWGRQPPSLDVHSLFDSGIRPFVAVG